ncbi:conserved Plasmodium protein, unknown function [Plasmodium berghei]|uniref:TFIIS N-terminal domain-containing protein n=2 Tax=Plasmodium berghei TaxID=5821 RepID=A0A509ADJ0_PLABA|nr:conserved Plasmodium protein, unknown function [Plasmodium berghei ANKA]CXI04107.1 conserved Plasmodium protein, unknown function [Plasmodium berghei]SCL92214.1 conserved Plasmodium protein, unknown function [Plasmodium berghei]SCM15616.1 conserved Plasmodium protein, unknown function [Plasmodium berghei]SCM17408.1 conserved Plasmodium protein, unknown function [Plasmodium berghei]SCN22690.1 conserved Plasmodium protein, unknown function [Plasmodium berghei]|eukprot:XP_034420213.1 conserved Plasmodium protein, unknown function [Plasmodium berghei ANKA]
MSNLKNIFSFFKSNENGDDQNAQTYLNNPEELNEQNEKDEKDKSSIESIQKDISNLQKLFRTIQNDEESEKGKKNKRKKNVSENISLHEHKLVSNENTDSTDNEINEIGNMDIENVNTIFNINNKSQNDTNKIILELKNALNINEKPNAVKIINGISQDEINVLDNWYILNKIKIIPCLFEDKPLNSGLLNTLYSIDPSFKNKKIKIIRYLKYTKKVYEQLLKKCSEINKEERKEFCENTILNIIKNDIQNLKDKNFMKQVILLINKEKNYINLKFYFQFLLNSSIDFYDLFIELNGIESIKIILQNLAKKNIIKKYIPLIIQIFNLLKKLNMTLHLLKTTLIGIPINLIAKNKKDIRNNLNYVTDNPQVQNIAQEIVNNWRIIRDETIKEIKKETNQSLKKIQDKDIHEITNESDLKQGLNNCTITHSLQYDNEINSDKKKINNSKNKNNTHNEGKNIMLEIIDTLNEEYEKKKKRHLEYKKAKIEGKIKKFSALNNNNDNNKNKYLLNDIINIQKDVQLQQAIKQKDKHINNLYSVRSKFDTNKNVMNNYDYMNNNVKNHNSIDFQNEKNINNSNITMDINQYNLNKNREHYSDNRSYSNKYNTFKNENFKNDNFKNNQIVNQTHYNYSSKSGMNNNSNYLKQKKVFSNSSHKYDEYNETKMYERDYMSNKNYNERYNKFQNKRKNKQYYDNYPNKFSNNIIELNKENEPHINNIPFSSNPNGISNYTNPSSIDRNTVFNDIPIINKHNDEIKNINNLFYNNNKEELQNSLNTIFKCYTEFEKIKENHQSVISSIYYPSNLYDDADISKTDIIIKFNYNKLNKVSIYLKYNNILDTSIHNDSNIINNNFNPFSIPELFPPSNLNMLKLPFIPIISNFTKTQNISSNIFPNNNQIIQSSISENYNRNPIQPLLPNKIYNTLDEFINIFDDNIKQILLKNIDLANLLMSKPDVVNKMLKGPQYINEALCSLEEELKSWGKPNIIS